MRYIGRTRLFDPQERLSENFRMGQFRSLDGYTIWNKETEMFVHMVQEFRTWFNRPMNVSSWYRTHAQNLRAGGASNSMHLQGLAIDTPWFTEYLTASATRRREIETNMATRWRQICEAYGIRGGTIIFYATFYHLDIRPRPQFSIQRG